MIDIPDDEWRFDRIDKAALIAAGYRAVRKMPADWYCPFDDARQRIDCPECIAAVALEAALAVLNAPTMTGGTGAVLEDEDDWHDVVQHPVWQEGCADCVARAEWIEASQR